MSLKQRKQKMTVVKRIEHRTSDGTLISASKSKTVYMNGFLPKEFETQNSENFIQPTFTKAISEHPHVNDFEEDFYKSSHENFITSTSTINYPTVTLSPQQPRTTIYNYRWEPKKIHPHSSYEWLNNETQRSTDDESSTTRSNDICVKECVLVRRHSAQSDFIIPNLRIIIKRINRLRILYKLPEFRVDNQLMQKAKEYASQMVLEKQIRVGNEKPMNVWTGRTVSEDIANEWDHEMSAYWRRNHFKCGELTRIGIGRARAFDLGLEVVVAIYA